jgi:hypothetical protein
MPIARRLDLFLRTIKPRGAGDASGILFRFAEFKIARSLFEELSLGLDAALYEDAFGAVVPKPSARPSRRSRR